jgi:hypothetical protein
MALSIFMKAILRARGIGKTVQKIQKGRGYKPGVATVKLPKKQAHELVSKTSEGFKGLRKQQITAMKFISGGYKSTSSFEQLARGASSLKMSPSKTPLQIKKQYAKVFKTSRLRKRIGAEKTWRKWIEKKGGLTVSKRELQGMKSLENPKVIRRFGIAQLKKHRLLPLGKGKHFI